jgi:hypothetical protein
MQRYAPEIERGNRKNVRLEAGTKYSDTLHQTVKQLHQDLPQEKATLEAEIAAMSLGINEQKASVAKTQRHLEAKEAKAQCGSTAEIQGRRAGGAAAWGAGRVVGYRPAKGW